MNEEIRQRTKWFMEDRSGMFIHWGYCNFDHQYKTPQMLVRKLVECASKGGNMILNVGPDKLESVTYLADGSEVNREKAWDTVLYLDVAFVSFGDNPVFTYPLPDEKDTVLKIRLRQE